MANQTTLVERIETRGYKREDSGQIAVGTHVLRIGSVHGGIVDAAHRATASTQGASSPDPASTAAVSGYFGSH